MNVTDEIETVSEEPVELVSPRRMRIDPSHDGVTSADASQQPLDPVGKLAPDPIEDSGLVQPALLEIEEPSGAMLSAVAAVNSEIREEQLRLEAEKLGEHL